LRTVWGCVFGPAPQLHGTTFVVEAELRRDALDADGIICDIGRFLDLLKMVLAEFDYRNLDEFAEFRGRNSTREFLACEVHKRLVRRIEEGALGSQAMSQSSAARKSSSSVFQATRRSDDQAPTVCFAST
jgi:6-pyruvoyltetrahydropterin/6-carboxytetrahydropterin synthase